MDLEAIGNSLETCGYAVFSNFVPENLVLELQKRLLEHIAQNQLSAAHVGRNSEKQVLETTRRDKKLWLQEPSAIPCETKFFAAIDELQTYLNRRFYLGIRSREFHYAVYERGAFYKKHLDAFRGLQFRKVTFIMYLNTVWTMPDGGQLRLYTDSGIVEILPNFAKCVCFLSEDMAHEVLVTYKQRLSITGWLRTDA